MEKNTTIMEILDEFGFKTLTKRVFVALTENGEQSAVDVATLLNSPKSSIYDSLAELIQAGFVNEMSGERSSIFVPASVDQIKDLKVNRSKKILETFEFLEHFVQNGKKSNKISRPRIKFYNGVDAIKQSFRDMSWSSKYKEAFLMWPMNDMLQMLGRDFLHNHSAERFKYGVVIRSIRKESERKLEKDIWLASDIKKNLREVRYLPKSFDWKMSYWVYGDKCLFAGSGEEKFSFIVHSKEFSNLMKILWEQMWQVAKV